MMFAARVPAVANSINDILGVARGAKPDRPDRSTHLFMLLFCYSSPVLLLICVSAMRKIANLRSLDRDANDENGDESPFSVKD
jgi:phage baseplate assembly protein W